MSSHPFLSLLLAVDDTTVEALDRTIASVVAQSVAEWELVVYPTSDGVGATRLIEVVGPDPRVRVLRVDGSAAERAQAAVDVASGEFLCTLAAGMELAPDVLDALRTAAASSPGLDVAYTDESVIAAEGVPKIIHKPAWSPERLRGHDYLGHLVAMRSNLVRDVGGLREMFDGAHELDLRLRACEAARGIARVGVVGVSRGNGGDAVDDQAWVAGLGAVQEHLDRVGIEGRAVLAPVLGTYRIERQLRTVASVSVVIPTEGRRGLAWGEPRAYVVEAVQSVLADSEHLRCDVVVVHNQDTPSYVLDRLRALGDRVRVDGYVGAFNFAAMCNRGVTVSGGQVVVLLDERTEIDSPGFLEQLVAPLLEPDVGITGPRVLASDGTVLEGGLAVFQDLYEPMFRGDIGDEGTNPALAVNRECSALGPTCVAVTRQVYEEVGGLHERRPNLAHVDLAMKIARGGLRRLWIANATLRHFPPPGREGRVRAGERRWLASRWAAPDLDLYDPTRGARQLRRAQRDAESSRADRLAKRRR